MDAVVFEHEFTVAREGRTIEAMADLKYQPASYRPTPDGEDWVETSPDSVEVTGLFIWVGDVMDGDWVAAPDALRATLLESLGDALPMARERYEDECAAAAEAAYERSLER